VGTRPLVPAARHRVRDHVEGAALVHPFEMDTVVSLFGGRLVATHYGLYNTVSGIVITCGNLAIGAVWDASVGQLRLLWLALSAVGSSSAGPYGAAAARRTPDGS
jgi:hypothetical protein